METLRNSLEATTLVRAKARIQAQVLGVLTSPPEFPAAIGVGLGESSEEVRYGCLGPQR